MLVPSAQLDPRPDRRRRDRRSAARRAHCRRRLARAIVGAALLGGASGCSAPPPTADVIAREPLPFVELDASHRARLAGHEEVALAALQRGEFDAALRAAKLALELDPRAARPRAVLARVLAEQARAAQPVDLGTMQRADGEARRASELAPHDVTVALLHAQVLEADGHLSAAAARVEQALGGQVRDLGLLREAARLRYELAEEKAARRWLMDLLVEQPSDAVSRYRLAQSWVQLAAAMPQITGAQRLEKEQTFLRAAQAFADYTAAVPDDAAGYLGEAHARFQAWLAAAPTAERDAAREQDQDDHGAVDEAQRLQQVLHLYEAAAQREPAAPDAWFGRGVVLERLGRLDEARAAYEAALVRDPHHVPTLLNLAALLASTGRRDEARPLAATALELGVDPFERQRLERWLAR